VSPLWRARRVAGVVVKAISTAGRIRQEWRIRITRSGPLITLPSPDAHALRLEGTDGPTRPRRAGARPPSREVATGPALLLRRRRKKAMTGGDRDRCATATNGRGRL
jgi:hypothetical protein